MLLYAALLAVSATLGTAQDYPDYSEYWSNYTTGSPMPQEYFPHVQEVLSMMGMEWQTDYYGNVMWEGFDGFDFITDELCRDVEQCADNMFYPCKCARGFVRFNSGEEQCEKLPCNLVNAVNDNMRGLLQGMADADTYEDVVEAMRPMMDAIFSDTICPCARQLLKGLGSCFRSNEIQEMMGRQEGRRVTRVLESAELKRFWRSLRLPLCSEGCGFVDMTALAGWARMIDETRERSGQCFDKSELIDEKMMGMMMMDGGFGDMISSIRSTAEDFWCVEERDCVEELDETFNNCCTRSFLDVFDRKNMKSVMKVMENVVDGSGMQSGGGRVIAALFRAMKPEMSCPGKYEKPRRCRGTFQEM